MGSKISVFIIVIATLVLASVVSDTSSVVKDDNKIVREDHKTYEETEIGKKGTGVFLFEDYPLEIGRHSGSVVEVDFSTNPLTKNFEEIIKRNVASVGVNYAGNYSIATWSCGLLCQNSAIVDVRDGSIFSYGILSSHGLSFSPDSTLLIINPVENVREGDDINSIETDYYSLINGTLTLQGKKIGSNGVAEDCIQVITKARNKITNEITEFSTPCQVPFGWELIP